MNLNPFIDLFGNLIGFYKFLVSVWVILSILVSFNIVNRHQEFVHKIVQSLDMIIEPVLFRIRKILPVFGGIDFSPVILFLLLDFLQDFLKTYFYVNA